MRYANILTMTRPAVKLFRRSQSSVLTAADKILDKWTEGTYNGNQKPMRKRSTGFFSAQRASEGESEANTSREMAFQGRLERGRPSVDADGSPARYPQGHIELYVSSRLARVSTILVVPQQQTLVSPCSGLGVYFFCLELPENQSGALCRKASIQCACPWRDALNRLFPEEPKGP